jgi:uncharacterized protein (TIGR00255 family)
MTGYGRAQLLTGGREISVEIKSVNHRYFEFSARVPRAYGYLEEKLKSFVHGGVQRGKTDAFVSIAAADDLNAAVEINRPLARSYLEALRGMGSTLDLKDDITVSALSRFPDLFVLRREQEDEAAVWQAVREAAAGALANMLAMREAEGGRLRADIMSRLALLEGFTARVEERSPGVTAEYRARLLAKLNEVLEGRQPDEGRILTEAAVFAEKTAVDEETVRLRSHIAQLREFLGQGGPVGRKLDFLVQELNREANTIGSKAQDLEIARVVVEMKSEIEKIREQVQNIE